MTQKRGRKSTGELSTVVVDQRFRAPPEPPKSLSRLQAEVWRETCRRLPGDWFRDHHLALLRQYCRHVVAADRVASLIKHVESGEALELPDYDRLLKMQERESRICQALATAMRLTHQSLDKKVAAAKARTPGCIPPEFDGDSAPKPWE